MMRVLSVLGTRPEAIKLAPVVRELARRPGLVSRVCLTGQHREMLAPILGLFGMHPDVDLAVMRPNQTPTQVASAVLAGLERVFADERPDWILVQGDTTTVAAAAWAAYYARIRVGHVEAGLRTGDKWQPFPEEVNRRIASVVADLHLAPTEQARQNLLREGIDPAAIVVTGNPVIDALHWASEMPCDLSQGALAQLDWSKRILVVTAHRRENHGEPLRQICLALREIATIYPDVVIVYPVHPNPNVTGPVYSLLGQVPGVVLLPPLDYMPFVHLLKRSYLVLTDSGGIQEEAPALASRSWCCVTSPSGQRLWRPARRVWWEPSRPASCERSVSSSMIGATMLPWPTPPIHTAMGERPSASWTPSWRAMAPAPHRRHDMARQVGRVGAMSEVR